MTRTVELTRDDDGVVSLELDGRLMGAVDPACVLVQLAGVLDLDDVADAARLLADAR